MNMEICVTTMAIPGSELLADETESTILEQPIQSVMDVH
jgi:hypothetical protein